MISWDRYEIKKELYESPSFLLYRALDKEENRAVLIKMLKPGHFTLPNIARWSWDLEVSRNLRQDFVLNPLRIEKNSSTLALVFEDSGLDLLLSKMPFRESWEKFFRFSLTLVDTLKQLHRQGIHRNLAPNNILVDSKGEKVKITGFGFFQYLGEEASKFTAYDLNEETRIYRAPEFLYTPPTKGAFPIDFYSLGAILFQMATGFPPFRPTGYLHLPSQGTEETPDPRRLNPDLPEGMSQIIYTLLSPSPGDRYGEAESLARDLTEAHQEWKKQTRISRASPKTPEDRKECLSPPLRDTTSTPSLSFSDFSYLDWMAFQKSCQLFFEKGDPPVLLQRWLRILMEVSGAQKGLWTFQEGEKKIEIILPLEESTPSHPHSLIEYALQKKEPVIFSSEKDYLSFMEDPYFLHCRPKSILILPFYNPSAFGGFLYLENNLMDGVFNFSRMEIIRLLCMQAYSFAEKITLRDELERTKTFLCPHSLCGELLNHFSEGIVCMDQSFKILWFNSKAAQILKGVKNFESGKILTHLNNRPIEEWAVKKPEGSGWHKLYWEEEGRDSSDVALVSHRNGLPGTRCFLILQENSRAPKGTYYI